MDPASASEVRALATVRKVAMLAEEASFMPALVEVTFPRVRGARAVRAAFEALLPVPETAWVRCRDLSAAEPFLGSGDERDFLASLAEFRPADALSAAQSALLRVLEHAGLVDILRPEEWQARAGAERAEAARRAEEESRRDAARLALEAARAAEERRQSEMRERADAARRALEAAKAAEAAWRRARDGNGEAGPSRNTERDFPASPSMPRTTELEFHALSEDMPPLEPPLATAPSGLEGDEPMVPVLTRSTLAPFEAPVPTTDPMGAPATASSFGDEDTLVRAMQQGRGHTDPYAAMPEAPIEGRPVPPPPARSGTDPYTPALGVEPGQTDPYAQALPRAEESAGTDEIPTPPARPFIFPAAATPTPPGGTADARTPPGGIMLEPEEMVLEPEALLLSDPDSAATPAAGTLVEDMSEALRRAGLEAPPELWQAKSTEAVGSKTVERTPLRLGPESAADDADSWKLVDGGSAERPGSFEAALRQVDGQLEALAGLRTPSDPDNPHTVPLATSDLDALVRASFESGEWTLGSDPGQDSGRIGLAALSGTPVPAPPPPSDEPPELSAARRQELLRQARAAAEREPVAGIPTPPPRSLEDAELAEAIEARHAGLTRDPDRFAVLGLPPGSGRDDVKRAFIELAKVFHPDRLPRSLAPAPSEGGEGVRRHPRGPGVPPRRRPPGRARRDPRRQWSGARAAIRAPRPRPWWPARWRCAGVSTRRPRPSSARRTRPTPARPPSPPRPGPSTWTRRVGSEGQRARTMMVDALKADPDCDRAHYQLGSHRPRRGRRGPRREALPRGGAQQSTPPRGGAGAAVCSRCGAARRRGSFSVRSGPTRPGPRARPCPAARTRCPCRRAALDAGKRRTHATRACARTGPARPAISNSSDSVSPGSSNRSDTRKAPPADRSAPDSCERAEAVDATGPELHRQRPPRVPALVLAGSARDGRLTGSLAGDPWPSSTFCSSTGTRRVSA